MYVVRVGDYYVKNVVLTRYENTKTLTIGDVTLSKEIMKNFDKNMAEMFAKKINGEVIEITENTTNE